MSFFSSVLAAVLEFFLAKAAALGMKEFKEIETETEIKARADLDSKALEFAKDKASRVAALNTIINDSFGEQDATNVASVDSSVKPVK
jgi:hypothetical protein